jgi:hypothetical protein
LCSSCKHMFGSMVIGFCMHDTTLPKFVNMPTCNFSESIHNTWLQMSG